MARILRKSQISKRQRKIPGKSRLDLKLTYGRFLLATTAELPPACLLIFFLVCAGTHLNHSLKKTNEKRNAWFCSPTSVGKLEIMTPTKYTLPVFCFYLNLDKSDWTHRMVSFLTGTYRSNWDLKGEFCMEIVGLLVFIKSVGISHVFINNAPLLQSRSHCQH